MELVQIRVAILVHAMGASFTMYWVI